MDCSLPGSSIHGIFQARVLEWGAIAFSDPYMTTGKTIALTLWTFVGKVMSLLFNMLSMFVIAFSSKEQACFNFMAAVTICSDFGAEENKVCHCFLCFPIYLPWSDGTRCHDPWKKSYDQPRQHIKKQRHYYANKGLSSQGCGFSSGHVWM